MRQPTPIAAPDEAELREILAEEFEKAGMVMAAKAIRNRVQMFERDVTATIAAMSRVRPTSTERDAQMREALQMVFDDLETCNDESGRDDWKSKELAEETIEAVIAALSQSPPPRMVEEKEMFEIWKPIFAANNHDIWASALAFGRALQERMK